MIERRRPRGAPAGRERPARARRRRERGRAATSGSKRCCLAARRARALGELAVRRRRDDRDALQPRRHPRRAAARRRAARVRLVRTLGGVGRAARRARRDGGSHAHLVGRAAASALRHARDPHRRPADRARAHGAHRRTRARRSSRTRRRGAPTAATTSRIAGRRRAVGLDAELLHPDGDGVVSARELARELLGAEPPEPEALAQLAAADACRGPRGADVSLTQHGDGRPRRSR